MDLRQLEVFRLIAQTGSFSAAAAQLGLTQSALSHQIRSLEEEAGEQLLARKRPRIHPTAAGQRLLESAGRIFAELSQVKESFGATRSGAPAAAVSGTVRVAATHLAIAYVYGDLLEHFAMRHPGVELVFHATETTEDPVSRVLQRDSDVGFTVLPQKHPKLNVTALFRAEQVLIVGRTHPLSSQRYTTVEELRRWPFARFEPRTGGRQVSDALFLPEGGYPPILAESNDVEYLKRIIRMGRGVALVPVFCVRNELQNRTIHALRLRGGRVIQDAGMVMRRDVSIRALELFRSVCVELGGKKLRAITLDNVDRPVFGTA